MLRTYHNCHEQLPTSIDFGLLSGILILEVVNNKGDLQDERT